MTDTNMDNGGPNQPPASPRKRRWGKRLLIGALLVGVGMVPGVIIGAHKATAWVGHMAYTIKHDPERMAERIDRRVEKVLSRVDATDEQKQKVSAAAKSAISDLAALGIEPGEARGKLIELMRADTIDPAAFEALRAEQVAKMETASKRLVTALTDAASALTPEQRRELTERWQRRHSRRWSE
ncbi:MAG: Spy/CpxP family protein refolding chaperone [Rhodomicrobiaceae bacterium]